MLERDGPIKLESKLTKDQKELRYWRNEKRKNRAVLFDEGIFGPAPYSTEMFVMGKWRRL